MEPFEDRVRRWYQPVEVSGSGGVRREGRDGNQTWVELGNRLKRSRIRIVLDIRQLVVCIVFGACQDLKFIDAEGTVGRSASTAALR